MKDLNRRHANRYRVSAAVIFWWPCSEGSIQASGGVTEDISTCGVLVATRECPPAGALVQMLVQLPRIKGCGLGMKLRGKGFVVRVDTDETLQSGEQGTGFAASVQFHPELPEDFEQPDQRRTDSVDAPYCN